MTRRPIFADDSMMKHPLDLKLNLLSIMKQIFLLVYALLFLSVNAFSQKSLKMTKAKFQSWNQYTEKWSGWSSNWQYFSKGKEPVLKLTKLDDEGSEFRVETWINDDYTDFSVAFKKYESENGWYVYEDSDGDQITIKGATLSSLCMYGWPKNVVQIYFWGYSRNFATVME